MSISKSTSTPDLSVYNVLIASKAQKDIQKIYGHDLPRIKERIISLSEDPRPMGIAKLEGPMDRVRVGDWRILFDIYDFKREVLVLRVLRRSERTYKDI